MIGIVNQFGKSQGINTRSASFVRGVEDYALIDSGAQACLPQGLRARDPTIASVQASGIDQGVWDFHQGPW
eukprot:4901591-Lingulodinium_polyedra.AAC.1